MSFEIIDFHTHPFANAKNNICPHTDVVDMSADSTLSLFKKLGSVKYAGRLLIYNPPMICGQRLRPATTRH